MSTPEERARLHEEGVRSAAKQAEAATVLFEKAVRCRRDEQDAQARARQCELLAEELRQQVEEAGIDVKAAEREASAAVSRRNTHKANAAAAAARVGDSKQALHGIDADTESAQAALLAVQEAMTKAEEGIAWKRAEVQTFAARREELEAAHRENVRETRLAEEALHDLKQRCTEASMRATHVRQKRDACKAVLAQKQQREAATRESAAHAHSLLCKASGELVASNLKRTAEASQLLPMHPVSRTAPFVAEDLTHIALITRRDTLDPELHSPVAHALDNAAMDHYRATSPIPHSSLVQNRGIIGLGKFAELGVCDEILALKQRRGTSYASNP
ncbi:hypothetical protein DIPPA_16293 [Diplonema papillatum]|nr:hypothetical protein DIPPA_16293 [Diplonema papillatum]|eukprot:gene11453-17618_t